MAGIGFPRTTPRPRVIEPDISNDELQALTFQPAGDYTEPIAPDNDLPDEDLIAEEEESSSRDVGDWRTARDQASRTRRPPQAEAA
jgi:hypothetical protein